MTTSKYPGIPAVPAAAGPLSAFLSQVKETLELLTGVRSPGAMQLPSYSLASLPANVPGLLLYAPDGRKNGEAVGYGSGAVLYSDTTGWKPANGSDLLLPAPQNLVPNSQWEICTALGYGPREKIDGTGPMPSVPITGNTTGSGTATISIAGGTVVPVVLSTSGSLGDLKAGDLVTVAGAGVDATLTAAPMRVQSLVPGTSVTVVPAVGGQPSVSHAGTLQAVNVGMSASSGTGAAGDGWGKDNGLIVWREDNAVNVAPGAIYSLGAKKTTGTQEYVGAYLDVTKFRGRNAVFGAYVYQKVRGGNATWRVFINGAVLGTIYSLAAPTTPGWNWIELTALMPTTETFIQVGVSFDGNSGDTYYFANPVAAVGKVIGPNNYVKPAEAFVPVVLINPISWGLAGAGATINFPATAVNAANYFDILFDAYAESGGAIAPSVVATEGQLEGRNTGTVQTGTGFVRAVGFRNWAVSPEIVGCILPQYVANVKSFMTHCITFAPGGYAWANSAVASDSWTNLALEFDRYFLR